MRVARIIQRKQEKKTMKTLIRGLRERNRDLREAGRQAFVAGKESVLLAAHGLSY